MSGPPPSMGYGMDPRSVIVMVAYRGVRSWLPVVGEKGFG